MERPTPLGVLRAVRPAGRSFLRRQRRRDLAMRIPIRPEIVGEDREGSNYAIAGLTSQDPSSDPDRRGAQLPLPPDPSRHRAAVAPLQRQRRQGRRDPGVAPPGVGPSPPGRTTRLLLAGPGVHRRHGEARPEGALVGVPRPSRDDPALASSPRATPLDLPTPARGATAASSGHRRAHRALVQGEPSVGATCASSEN